MIKRYMPKGLKQFLWYLFKAPQRKWIGWSSLYTDLRAWFSALTHREIYYRITVCVGVKDRSRPLLDHLVKSMREADFYRFLELSVFDCGSSDVEDLEAEIRSVWKGTLHYTREEMPFARSLAFNRAVEPATSEMILICDADMSLPRDIVRKASRYTTRRSAWFPMVWYTNEDGSGRYYTESTGMLSCFKKDFMAAGRYDESIREWGKEDWLLFFAFYKAGIGCIRTKEREFIHHWHPSLKPEHFVPLF